MKCSLCYLFAAMVVFDPFLSSALCWCSNVGNFIHYWRSQFFHCSCTLILSGVLIHFGWILSTLFCLDFMSPANHCCSLASGLVSHMPAFSCYFYPWLTMIVSTSFHTSFFWCVLSSYWVFDVIYAKFCSLWLTHLNIISITSHILI